jgi:hypothetical protein
MTVDQMRRGPDLSEVRALVRKPLISVYGQPMGGKSAVLVFDRKLEEALKTQGELRRVACGVRATERVSAPRRSDPVTPAALTYKQARVQNQQRKDRQ